MKKFLLSLIALLGVTTYALADEVIVPDVEIRQGSTGTMTVNFEITSDVIYRDFQFDIVLPEGIELATDEDGAPIGEKGNACSRFHTVNPGLRTTGYAAQEGVDIDKIKLQSGTLVTFQLEATGNFAIGDELNASLQSLEISNNEGQAALKIAEIPFTIKIVEDRIIFDETSTTLPAYTAGEKGNVRMNRTIKPNNWSTIVLPFTLTKAKAEAAFGTDVQLAEFAGFEVEYTDEEDIIPNNITINFASYAMTTKKGMTGGKLYLIKTSAEVKTFDADDVTLVASVEDVNKTDEYDTPGKFTGSLVKTVVPADGLYISDNKFFYSTGKTNIKGFRGWFELGAVLDKETEFGVKLNILVDGDETAIEDIRFVDTKGAVYTIDGKFIGRDVDLKKLQKGIYVVDGKKVAIK